MASTVSFWPLLRATRPSCGPATASLALAGLVLLAACGPGEATGGQAPSTPRGAAGAHGATSLEGTTTLTFEAPKVDLGSVWEGELLEHKFRGRVGDLDLTLVGVKPDCGCATPELELLGPEGRRTIGRSESIPAGSELELTVRYDTAGRVGKQPRSIVLFGNLPDGVGRVEFAAEVRPWLITEPTLADLGRVRPADERTASFQLRSVDGSPVGLAVGPGAQPNGVSTELVALEPDADGRSGRWRLDVHIGHGLPRGKHRLAFPLVTDRLRPDAGDDLERTFKSSVMLMVEGAGQLSLGPDVVRLGTMQPDQTVARTIRLSVHAPGIRLTEPIARIVPATSEDLVRLRASGGDLEFARTVSITPRAVPGQPAWDLELLVRGLDEGVPHAFAAMLEVETGYAEEPVLHALIQGVRAR